MVDAVLKFNKDPDYYILPSQVNQQSVRKSISAFQSYFKAAEDYKNEPGKYTGKPRMPRYIKGRKAALIFTNQVCKESDAKGEKYFSFPGTDFLLDAGPSAYIPANM